MKKMDFKPKLGRISGTFTFKEQKVQTVHTGHRQGWGKERKTRGNNRKVMISLTRIHL